MNYRNDDSVKNLQRHCDDQDLRKLVLSVKTGLEKADIPAATAHHLTPAAAISASASADRRAPAPTSGNVPVRSPLQPPRYRLAVMQPDRQHHLERVEQALFAAGFQPPGGAWHSRTPFGMLRFDFLRNTRPRARGMWTDGKSRDIVIFEFNACPAPEPIILRANGYRQGRLPLWNPRGRSVHGRDATVAR